jgi:trimethylamine--corrinoid protein Co-methyltransferase
MFSIITAMLSRCNLIHDNGYLEYGSTSSLEMVAIADELVAMSRFFTRGIPVNKTTLALEALERVKDAGPQAFFLMDDHTFENFEQALFIPKLLDRSRFDSWAAEGEKDLYRRSNETVRQILAEHRVAPKDDAVLKEIDTLVNTL